MIAQNIARRYGRAIYQIAAEDGRLDDYYQELKGIADLLHRDESLRNLLRHQVFTTEECREALGDVFLHLKTHHRVSAFLLFLVEQKRIQWLDKILDFYRVLTDEAQGILRVKVSAPGGLSPEANARMGRWLAQATAKRVEMDIDDDPSLLGGVVIRIGDMLYDGSLKRQLHLMKLSLLDQ